MPFLIGSFEYPVKKDEPDVPVVPDEPDEPDVPVVPDEPDEPVEPDEPDIPEYSFSGSYSVLDNGETSGVYKIALLGSGSLSVTKAFNSAVIKAQGGGGSGGAGNESTSGSDGEDGAIQTRSGQTLNAGTYSVVIGSGGSRTYDQAGTAGGSTSLGSIISASGGAGGAYAGGESKSHSGIYSSRGKGGTGGTTSMYTGEKTTKLVGYYVNSSGYADIRSNPGGGDILGRLYPGDAIEVESRNRYEASDGSDWFKVKSGGYIPDATCNLREETTDTRSWYGNEGNPGAILISVEV